ncbi:MAG: hypothetical protein R2710_29180 [Acidimicrobiales bacterium]
MIGAIGINTIASFFILMVFVGVYGAVVPQPERQGTHHHVGDRGRDDAAPALPV